MEKDPTDRHLAGYYKAKYEHERRKRKKAEKIIQRERKWKGRTLELLEQMDHNSEAKSARMRDGDRAVKENSVIKPLLFRLADDVKNKSAGPYVKLTEGEKKATSIAKGEQLARSKEKPVVGADKTTVEGKPTHKADGAKDESGAAKEGSKDDKAKDSGDKDGDAKKSEETKKDDAAKSEDKKTEETK